MAKVKTFYCEKGFDKAWKPLTANQVQFAKINGDFQVIEIIMQLVTLYGLIFPTKVPTYIKVDEINYYLTIKHKPGNVVMVGYANNDGTFFKLFTADKEKKAKKALAEFLKSKGIV